MDDKKTVELFSAGCPICVEATETVRRIAADATVTIHDMTQPESVRRAQELRVRSLPAVAIDGELADCCSGRGVREETIAAVLAQ